MLKAEQTEAERVRGELVTAEAKAERDLSFTEIRAPFDGVVGNKAAVVGQYALPGTRLLAVVPVSRPMSTPISRRPSSTRSARAKRSTSRSIRSTARVVPGVVESVSPASGAQFSLLPPDNATGNFTKVVQRVTVRIAIAPEALAREPLRPGLSVVATIHTRDESQPRPTLLGLFGLGAAAGKTARQ